MLLFRSRRLLIIHSHYEFPFRFPYWRSSRVLFFSFQNWNCSRSSFSLFAKLDGGTLLWVCFKWKWKLDHRNASIPMVEGACSIDVSEELAASEHRTTNIKKVERHKFPAFSLASGTYGIASFPFLSLFYQCKWEWSGKWQKCLAQATARERVAMRIDVSRILISDYWRARREAAQKIEKHERNKLHTFFRICWVGRRKRAWNF